MTAAAGVTPKQLPHVAEGGSRTHRAGAPGRVGCERTAGRNWKPLLDQGPEPNHEKNQGSHIQKPCVLLGITRFLMVCGGSDG